MTERSRSPRYPSMDIESAILAAKTIYEKEGRSAFPTVSLANALGHKTLSGAANSKIGSLNQFELIGTEGRGRYRLTEAGMTLAVADPSSSEFRDTLIATVRTPPVFADLFANYSDSSNQTLRHELIVKRGFSSEAADRLISAFRRTADFIRPFAEIQHVDETKEHHVRGAKVADVSESESSGDVKLKRRVPLSFQLRPGLLASISFTGEEEGIDDIELLKDYLDLHIRGIKRKINASPSRPVQANVNSEVANIDLQDSVDE